MAVISLTPNPVDAAGASALHHAAVRAFSKSIRAAAQYAVELNPFDVAHLRKNLGDLAEQAANAPAADDYGLIHSALRGELRLYRDRSVREISRIRADIEAASAVMQSLATSVTGAGADHETRVKEELRLLESAAAQHDLPHVREAIQRTTRAVWESCEQMRLANQRVIAQLQDEIRILHQEADKGRRAQLVDRATGAWNRAKIETKIKDLIRLDQPFHVFVMGIGNLPDLLAAHTQQRVDETYKAMLARLDRMVGEDVLLGRWNDDVFAAVFDVPLSVHSASAAQIEQQLAGAYSVQDSGSAHELRLALKAAVVERPKGASEAEFFPRLGQAMFEVTC